jgi:hypothetical protein
VTHTVDAIHDADPEITEELKWRRPRNPMGTPVFEHDGIVLDETALKALIRSGVEHNLAKGKAAKGPQIGC